MKKCLPYALVLVAFAVRLYRFDLVRYSHDFAIPHSYGIRILEVLRDGRWSDLPLLSLPSGVQVMNPAGASYYWALVALVDRSPLLPIVISILLSTLGVAMIFDLGRRSLGRRSLGRRGGWVAAALAATSIYAVYIARGTWIQGQLEFAAIGTAWLVWRGLAEVRPRRVLAGFAFAALMMQTYLATMAVGPMAMLSCVLAWPRLRQHAALRRAVLIGSGLCVLSALIFGVLLVTQGQRSLGDFQSRYAQTARRSNSQPLDALTYALTAPTGVDFDYTQELVGSWQYRQADPAPRGNQIAALGLSLVMAVGALRLLGRLRAQDPQALFARWTLAWFAVPVVLGIAAVLVNPALALRPQYLLLTSPAGYLLAGAGVMPLRRRALAPVLNGATALVCGVALLNGVPRIVANIDDIGAKPFADRIDFLPVGAQIKLGQVWRADCAEVANPQLHYWTASAKETPQGIRQGGAQWSASSNVWEIKPDGGTCTSRMNFEPAPPLADKLATPLTLHLNADTAIVTYRSLPVTDQLLSSTLPAKQPLWLSLSWMLIGASAPAEVRAGQPITLTHAWRIAALPDAAHDDWDYTLYVHVVALDGTTRPLVETGQLPPGVLWRAGDVVLSEVTALWPSDLTAGTYTLHVSLYDRAREDTAVFFPLNARDEPVWDQPMLALTQTITMLP